MTQNVSVFLKLLRALAHALIPRLTFLHSVQLPSDFNLLVLHYTDQDTEAASVVLGKRPPKVWPTNGCIRVENLWLRYREDLDPVLRGISFETNTSEYPKLNFSFKILEHCSGT